MAVPVFTTSPISQSHYPDHINPYTAEATDTTRYDWAVFKIGDQANPFETFSEVTSGMSTFTPTYKVVGNWFITVTAIGPDGSTTSSFISYTMKERFTTDQVLADQVKLGIRYGNPDYTAVTLVVSTLSDPAINPVRVQYNGNNVPVTMVAVGLDAPIGHPFNGLQAGWVGNVRITGLSRFPVRTPFTVIQGADTDGGSFICKPSEAQQNKIAMGTCDYPYGGLDGGVDKLPPQEPQASGAWPALNAEAEKNDGLWAIFMIDDTSYPDQFYIIDTLGTGHVITDINSDGPEDTKLAYDYCLAYFCHQGMYQHTDNIQYTDPWNYWENYKGRNPARLWAFRNLNYIPQYGDHEVTNDFALQHGNTRAAYPAWWAAAITNCYDHFMKPLQPPSIANASAANHWAISNGFFNIVAGDGIYHGSGDVNLSTGLITTLFGNDQIDDILDALNSDEPFKIFANVYQLKWLDSTTPSNNRQNGASWPLYNRCLPEFQRLVTNTDAGVTPKLSIMNNPKLNGTDGICVVADGDYHHLSVRTLKKAAYANNAAEDLSEFHVGTIGASTNFQFPYTEGNTYEDQLLEYNADAWGGENAPKEHMASSFSLIEFFPERPARMTVEVVNTRGDSNWTQEHYSREYVLNNTPNSGQVEGAQQFDKQAETGSLTSNDIELAK